MTFGRAGSFLSTVGGPRRIAEAGGGARLRRIWHVGIYNPWRGKIRIQSLVFRRVCSAALVGSLLAGCGGETGANPKGSESPESKGVATTVATGLPSCAPTGSPCGASGSVGTFSISNAARMSTDSSGGSLNTTATTAACRPPTTRATAPGTPASAPISSAPGQLIHRGAVDGSHRLPGRVRRLRSARGVSLEQRRGRRNALQVPALSWSGVF